jgi:hypothetical protein
MVVFGGPECRAESIHMSIIASGGVLIDVDNFTTGGTSTSYGTVNLANLNAALANASSNY